MHYFFSRTETVLEPISIKVTKHHHTDIVAVRSYVVHLHMKARKYL